MLPAGATVSLHNLALYLSSSTVVDPLRVHPLFSVRPGSVLRLIDITIILRTDKCMQWLAGQCQAWAFNPSVQASQHPRGRMLQVVGCQPALLCVPAKAQLSRAQAAACHRYPMLHTQPPALLLLEP